MLLWGHVRVTVLLAVRSPMNRGIVWAHRPRVGLVACTAEQWWSADDDSFARFAGSAIRHSAKSSPYPPMAQERRALAPESVYASSVPSILPPPEPKGRF